VIPTIEQKDIILDQQKKQNEEEKVKELERKRQERAK